jgi:enoyl-[acyl-carrier protein] reductase I
MGVAKAALDSSVWDLAWDRGQQNIRVNAISTGPRGHWRPARSPAFRRRRRSWKSVHLHRPIDADDVGAAVG